MTRRTVLAVLLLLLLLAGCGSSGNESDGSPESDASARVSCSHFRNVAGDMQAGILNFGELRDKLKEINESASVSEDAEIRENAEYMLKAATIENAESMRQAITGFDAACDRLGL